MAHNKTIKGFHNGDPASDSLANDRRQFIEIYHVPTGKTVSFKAFLTRFSDSYASEWNDEFVFGRMDPISTFKGTKRVISLGWDVVAASQAEAHRNLERCSLLMTMLYPTYEEQGGGAQTINASPLVKLKFSNLIENSTAPGGDAKLSGLLGKVGGFTYEPDLESGFFDPYAPISPDVHVGQHQLYPQTIRLNCEFTVLHQHELGFTADGGVKKDFTKFPYSHGKHNYAVEDPKTQKPLNNSKSASDRTIKKADTTITKNQRGKA